MSLARPKRSLPVRIEHWSSRGESTVIGYAEVTTTADATLAVWSERLTADSQSGALVAIDQSTDAILALRPLAVAPSGDLPAANAGMPTAASEESIPGDPSPTRGRFGRRLGVREQARSAANRLLRAHALRGQ